MGGGGIRARGAEGVVADRDKNRGQQTARVKLSNSGVVFALK